MLLRVKLLSFLVVAGVSCGCGGKAVIDPDEGAGGSDVSSPTSTGSGTGSSIQGIRLEQAFAFADCFPGGPGEITVELRLALENVASKPAVVELVEARLSGAVGQTTFDVSPATVTVSAMSTQSFDFVTVGPAVGTRACEWCDSMDTSLDLDLRVDGTERTFMGSVSSVSCVF